MNTQERYARLVEIHGQLLALEDTKTQLNIERAKLSREEDLEHYCCLCVKVNQDIGVFDMQQQSAAQRRPLGLGLVADTLSADRNCLTCKGEGVPVHDPETGVNAEDDAKFVLNLRPIHNHFGEVFAPTTCPACKAMKEGAQKS